jgi:hypothetical protein
MRRLVAGFKRRLTAGLANEAAKSAQRPQAAIEMVAKARFAFQYERDALIRAELSPLDMI